MVDIGTEVETDESIGTLTLMAGGMGCVISRDEVRHAGPMIGVCGTCDGVVGNSLGLTPSGLNTFLTTVMRRSPWLQQELLQWLLDNREGRSHLIELLRDDSEVLATLRVTTAALAPSEDQVETTGT